MTIDSSVAASTSSATADPESTDQPVDVARTRFGGAALLIALAILLFGVFSAVFAAACGVLTQVLPDPNFGYDTYVLPVARQAFAAATSAVLPAAVAAFLFYWGVLPLHPGLRFGAAAGRSAVAALVAVIVGTIGAIVRIAQGNLGLIFAGGSFSAKQLEYSAATGIALTASVLPLLLSLVVLGGLILWNWTRRGIRSTASDAAPDAV
jgi:hypothetical protein